MEAPSACVGMSFKRNFSNLLVQGVCVQKALYLGNGAGDYSHTWSKVSCMVVLLDHKKNQHAGFIQIKSQLCERGVPILSHIELGVWALLSLYCSCYN